jgi:hypothetical protein
VSHFKNTLLRPGGVFWALTPNGSHPFCRLSQTVEVLGLKAVFARSIRTRTQKEIINDIPSYYRLNRPAQIVRASRPLPFSNVPLCVPALRAVGYVFPRRLRWLPHVYNRTLDSRFQSCMQVLAYRLERGE